MIDQKVIDYIRASLSQGKTKEDLYKELIERGWAIEVIQENFNAVNAEQENENTSKKTIRIIVTIGAILVGAGVFSFIATDWQEISKPVKIGIILISMLASYGAGWYLKEKLNLEKTGVALFLLGTIIYGAGIFLISQMFYTGANWPDGLILWMFGAIAVAFALESFPHFCLAIFLGFVAVIGYFGEISTGVFGYHVILSTSSFLLLAVTIITFITGWITRKRMPPELKEFY